MNVLVVDDEIGTRGYLAEMLRSFGGLDVREAAHGRDALEQMEADPSRIVLTDIRMPVMDGLELIRQCRSRFPDVWFVVLSNFAEFELAQQALQYGARNYLLKATITRQEVEREIRRAFLHYEQAGEQQSAPFNANELIMVRNSLFHERLDGHIRNEELLRRAARFGVGAFDESKYLPPSKFAILEVERFEEWKDAKFQGRTDLAVYALSNVASETIRSWNESNELFHLGQNRFVALDLEETDDERHARKLREMLAVAKRYLALEASALSHCGFSGMDDFFEQVRHARERMDCFFYETEACVLDARTVRKPEAELDLLSFFQSAEGGGRIGLSGLPGLVETYFELLRHLGRPSSSAKADVQTLTRFIEKNGFSVPASLKTEVERLQAYRLSEYKRLFVKWLEEVGGADSQREEIVKALAFIHERYASKLSLEGLCAHVNLSRSHLSKLFKTSQGVSVMEYLEAYRLRQARLLLRTTKDPIAEVGERVGIGDVFYFSKVYKKHFGINPSKDR
ncbi:response regulator [Cohnella sp.]|uniref:response regulator n=1 Tax=Cohnella sp. TaxID=1883426 RepID=UPI0035621264